MLRRLGIILAILWVIGGALAVDGFYFSVEKAEGKGHSYEAFIHDLNELNGKTLWIAYVFPSDKMQISSYGYPTFKNPADEKIMLWSPIQEWKKYRYNVLLVVPVPSWLEDEIYPTFDSYLTDVYPYVNYVQFGWTLSEWGSEDEVAKAASLAQYARRHGVKTVFPFPMWDSRSISLLKEYKEFFDAVNLIVHWAPEARNADQIKEWVSEIRAEIGNKPVFVTVDYPGLGAYSNYINAENSEEAQKKYLPEYVRAAEAAGADYVLVYQYRDGEPVEWYQEIVEAARTGVVREDGSKKPVYYVLLGEPEKTEEENRLETEWEVKIDSPYRYEYRIEGNYLYLTLHVNYVARNGCYGVYTEVVPMRCINCYDVYVRERVPRENEFCTQVIREIPTVTTKIGPLSTATTTIYVKIHPMGKEENLPGIPIDIGECMKLEAEIVRLERYVESCMAGEGCEDLGDVMKRLDDLKAEFRKKCRKEPPEVEPTEPIKPITPSPPIRIIKPGIPIHEPVKIGPIEIKSKDGKPVIVSGNVQVEVQTELKAEEGKLISAPSGKEIKIDPEKALEKLRERVRIREVLKVMLKDSGVEPAYEIEGEEEGRLLGFIPVKLKVKAQVNAENGEVKRVEKPWWSFLVWG